MTFTIVLIPNDEAPFATAAQNYYGNCEPSYLLNGSSSFAHITIVQFDPASRDEAQAIWQEFCQHVKTGALTALTPHFIGSSFIEGKGPYAGTTWIELAVERGPIAPIHKCALKALSAHGLNPLNASGENFRPHLTLARAKLCGPLKLPMVKSTTFHLALGLSDEKWQLAKILEKI